MPEPNENIRNQAIQRALLNLGKMLAERARHQQQGPASRFLGSINPAGARPPEQDMITRLLAHLRAQGIAPGARDLNAGSVGQLGFGALDFLPEILSAITQRDVNAERSSAGLPVDPGSVSSGGVGDVRAGMNQNDMFIRMLLSMAQNGQP